MGSLVAIDFETRPIGEDAPYPKPVCLSFYDGKEEGIVAGDTDILGYLSQHLPTSTLIAHNVSFEANVIWAHFPSLRDDLLQALRDGRFICTKIYEQLLDNLRSTSASSFSLAALVSDYFGKDISAGKSGDDSWRLRYQELEAVPLKDWPPEAVQYSLDDSIWAYKIYSKQRKSKVNFKECVEAEVFLNLIGALGIAVDVARVEQLEAEIYSLLEDKYSRLIAAGFCTRVRNSKRPKKNMKRLREYLQETIKTPQYTVKNIVSTSLEAMQAYFAETNDSVLQDFIDVNIYDKVITAFICNLKTPVIRSQYSAVKSTGRTSSFKSGNYPSVNIQQMPRQVPGVTHDIRNCYVPRPGYRFVSIDYSGLELASTAHQLGSLFGHSHMRDLLNSGEEPTDLHSHLGARIMSMKEKRLVTYETFVANKKQKPYSHYRTLAKPINLGFPGGIGYDTMRYLLARSGIRPFFEVLITGASKDELVPAYLKFRRRCPDMRIARLSKTEWGIVRDELVELKAAMFSLYPELERFLKDYHTNFETNEHKYMKNEFGEWEREPMHKYTVAGFTRNWVTYTAVCNGYLMQSPSAVGAKRAVISAMRKYAKSDEVHLLAFIHDEICFEVLDTPEKYAIIQDIAEIMIDSMQTVLSSVRIAVEASEMGYWKKSGGDWERTYWKNSNDTVLHMKE